MTNLSHFFKGLSINPINNRIPEPAATNKLFGIDREDLRSFPWTQPTHSTLLLNPHHIFTCMAVSYWEEQTLQQCKIYDQEYFFQERQK